MAENPCIGADDPEERCPRHPNDCTCWQVDPIPVPRGGIEPDWHAACILLHRRFRKLEKAARAVVAEADRIHDNQPWPLKYQAPYAAITALREILTEVGTPDARSLIQKQKEG